LGVGEGLLGDELRADLVTAANELRERDLLAGEPAAYRLERRHVARERGRRVERGADLGRLVGELLV
jgi:hypothetical protein